MIADGMRYRAMAFTLQIPVNEARNASRSCERKRERFQLLYDTGRLCGYRAGTIQALQAGELTGDELARRAFAHLEACASCRAEHKTNAKRLARSFREQLTALLPPPLLLNHLGWLRRWFGAGAHPRGAVRERAAALIGTAGAGAKLTAGAAAVAVVAAGTIGATHALEHDTRRAHLHAAAAPPTIAPEALMKRAVAPPHDTRVEPASPRRTIRRPPGPLVMACRNQAASPPAVVSQGTAERQFGPESTPRAWTSGNETASHLAEGGEVAAAEREFGS
jgi:hypothetical protein